MIAKRHSSIVALVLTIVLCANLLSIQVVRADGETPTEPPAPTEAGTEPSVEPLSTEPPSAVTQLPTEPPVLETELPTEPPVVETPVPVESAQAPEDVTETPVAEVLSQVPENTDIVVLDKDGNEVSLASQDAAEIVEMTDPMWCPAGVLPGGNGCSAPYGTIGELITNMSANPSFYDEAGIIYFTSSAGGSLQLSDQRLGSAYNTLKNFDLTLRGGWDGSTDSPTFNGQTNFGASYLRIGTVANPWVGNIVLDSFEFSSASATVVSVYTTTGDISVNNVDVTNHLGNVTASLNSASGDITVQNSTFSGNGTAPSRGFTATTGGSISVSNTAFTDAGTNPNNGSGYNGATLNAPVVTLTNVTATGNDGSGIFMTGTRLVIIGGEFSNNLQYGVRVSNPAATTIYIQANPLCTGNGVGCYNDATIFDDTAPVITPGISGAAEVNGWYGGNVSVSWTVEDAESGVNTSAGCTTSNLTSETSGTTLTCSATNNAGLSSSKSVTIRIDKTGPVLSSSNVTVEATGPAGAAVSYPVSAVDAVDGPVPVNCLPASGSILPLGSTSVSCSTSDLRGNTNSTSFLVTVNDTTAPSIEPLAKIVTSTHKRYGDIIFYTDPATADLVDGAGVATCSPASGSLFSLGQTRVTCTATDAHGNRATRTFLVSLDYEKLRPTPEAPISSPVIIPATADDLIDLDASTVFWAFGVKFSFVNLEDQQAAVHEVTARTLPAALPDGFSLVLGVQVDVLTDGKLLEELPTGSSLKMDFPMAGGASDQFAILYWNGSEWTTLAEQNGNGSLPQILSVTVDKPGIFVLVKK